MPGARFSYDVDEPGEKYARQVAAILHGLAREVSIIDAAAMASLRPDGGRREAVKGWDAADCVAGWPDMAALRKAAHCLAKHFEPPLEPEAPAVPGRSEWPEPCDINQEIARLAKLRAAEYEQVRKDAALKLGIRVAILDKLVAAERPKESKQGQGRRLELPEPEPWPEPVDGTALVSELTSAIRRYVVLSDDATIPVALWLIHTFCFDAFQCTPRLAITSPEKRCGKTTSLM